MLASDLQLLAQPVSSDSPAGLNLEYDPRFVEMSRLAEGTREQQYGDTIIPAQPPDWRGAMHLAESLATETRDLRVAVMLVECLTHFKGIDGLNQGLALLQEWVCHFWDHVHPQLDEADGRDPFVRINALGRLCDTDRLIKLIMKMPLAHAPPHMVITLSDVRHHDGHAIPSSTGDWAKPMEIDAAFMALPLGELRHRHETGMRSVNALISTVDFLEQACGRGVWDASELISRINACTDLLKKQLQSRLSASDAVVADVSAKTLRLDTSHDSTWVPHHIDQPISSLSRFRVDSREEAAQVIDAATKYFELHEPSSPVPLLLRRAKRMINQDFVDILRDLAPGALEQAKSLTGEFEK